MKAQGFAIAALAAVAAATAADLDFLRPEIIPEPRELRYESSVAVRIDGSTAFAVTCPDAAAAQWVKDKVAAWFGARIGDVALASAQGAPGGGDEGYTIEAKPGRIAIGANSIKGVKHAMHALRQVAERESVGVKLKGYWLPALSVKDSPALAFRGIHFCWFPECPVSLIERQIRVAAMYRFNYVVLESWGVFRNERHPFLAVRDAPLTVKEARRLAGIASDLGVTLIPQVNVYGHAAMQRARGGKHTTLDMHPECQPLFEPGGWNWCLSNPDARQVVRDLVAEIHEAFGNPPFFHIGCDEADPPTCAMCRAARPYSGLVMEHIKDIAGLLRKRGARAMMWHDMLLEKGRWKPFYSHGDENAPQMLDALPRDIVICDWYYGSDSGGHDKTAGTSVTGNYPTLEHFKSKGFDTLTCPWRERKGIVAQAKYAHEHGLFGMLETIWHHYRGMEFGRMVEIAACGAWGTERRDAGRRGSPFATNWRRCGWDAGITEFSETGFLDRQVTRDVDD